MKQIYRIKNYKVLKELLCFANENSSIYQISTTHANILSIRHLGCEITLDDSNLIVSGFNDIPPEALASITTYCEHIYPTADLSLTAEELDLIICYVNDFDIAKYQHCKGRLHDKVKSVRKSV